MIVIKNLYDLNVNQNFQHTCLIFGWSSSLQITIPEQSNDIIVKQSDYTNIPKLQTVNLISSTNLNLMFLRRQIIQLVTWRKDWGSVLEVESHSNIWKRFVPSWIFFGRIFKEVYKVSKVFIQRDKLSIQFQDILQMFQQPVIFYMNWLIYIFPDRRDF